MKKWLLLMLLMMPTLALGQSFYSGQSFGVNPVSSTPIFNPYASIRVCNYPATGSPCTPLASVTDVNGNPLTVPGGGFGQVTADVAGRYTFGCSSGQIFIQEAAVTSNTPTRSFPAVCAGGIGTVTNFTAGAAAPLFTTNVATGTTTPALTFSLSNAAGSTVWGNCAATLGAPSYCTISPAMLGLTTTNDLVTVTGGVLARLATGTAHQLLHGGNSWGSVDLTTEVVNNLPVNQVAPSGVNGQCIITSAGATGWGSCAGTAGTQTLFRDFTIHTNTGNTTQNTIDSFTLNGNTLGVNGALMIVITGIVNTQGAGTSTVRVKLGASIVAAFNTSSSCQNFYKLTVFLTNRNATNSQWTVLDQSEGGSTCVSAPTALSSAVDTTVNQTVALTIQNANAGDNIETDQFMVSLQ